jgi:phosphoglucosamine mutase
VNASPTSAPHLFGTDGVRGFAGRPPLDPPTVARLGAAIVSAHPLGRPARLVIGRDTRESGVWIEAELARGAASEGAVVTTVGVLPTPAIAYLAGALEFDLGVVISASHNPFEDNGIKVFSGRGEKFGEAEERAVEAAMHASAGTAVADGASPPVRTQPIADAYRAHVARLFPDAGRLRGARLAVDMANGATTTTAAAVLGGMGFDLLPIGDRPDGRNINLACGSTHPARLIETVVARQCRLGVAFDGDGDRAIFVDHRGHLIDGDAVLLLLALAHQRAGTLAGDTVVATVMSNLGLEIALRDRGIGLVRTPVGDKHVMEAMVRHGYVLGGEQSGHVILAEHLFTGDGLATALAVLRVMADTGAELAELAAPLVTCPQTLVNVRVHERRPIDTVPEVAAAIARVEAAQAGRGRLLVRYSGTEPLLRVMVEGEDQATVQAWAEEVAQAARDALG